MPQTPIEENAPTSIEDASLTPRGRVWPSPVDWSGEILYFLLPDRFSDGKEAGRSKYDPKNKAQNAIPNKLEWMNAGNRFNGGTIKGVESKLDYLQALGVTCLWVGPVWKQRSDLETYHGYGIQNFLEIDPRFGTRQDLRDLVDAAHDRGMRIILDVIFNHSGNNWFYDDNGVPKAMLPYRHEPAYPFHGWRSSTGTSIPTIQSPEDGVWPVEFQNPEWYTRAGHIEHWDDPERAISSEAEFRRGDFGDLKDLNLDESDVLDACCRAYEYWIALTDCDGFRIDTVKHIPPNVSAIFCHHIRVFCKKMGKKNFLLLGEVTGSTDMARVYVDPKGPNLDAVLDIESAPRRLSDMVKGMAPADDFFSHFGGRDAMGDVRKIGKHHVSVLDDHDMVWREQKHRFAWLNMSKDSCSQTAHAVGVQLTTPGIPCIYYGTEQCFVGSEADHDESIEGRGIDGRIPAADRYVRECMFGGPFGAFQTQGCHFFDENHASMVRIAAIARLRSDAGRVGAILREGELHVREVRPDGDEAFHVAGQGQLCGWSRVLPGESIVVCLNTNGAESRTADVTVDKDLHPAGSTMRYLYRGEWTKEQLRHPPQDQFETVRAMEDGRCYLHIELPVAGMAILM